MQLVTANQAAIQEAESTAAAATHKVADVAAQELSTALKAAAEMEAAKRAELVAPLLKRIGDLEETMKGLTGTNQALEEESDNLKKTVSILEAGLADIQKTVDRLSPPLEEIFSQAQFLITAKDYVPGASSVAAAVGAYTGIVSTNAVKLGKADGVFVFDFSGPGGSGGGITNSHIIAKPAVNFGNRCEAGAGLPRDGLIAGPV